MANSCEPQHTIDLSNATSISIYIMYTAHEWIAYLIVWPCIILCGLSGNMTFIWTVMRTPSLHTMTFKYLVSLAVSDILTVLCFGILNIVYFTTSMLRGRSFVFYLLPTFVLLCSVGTITLVSVDRFLAICHPIKHRLVNGTKRTNLLLCCTWSVSFCYALLVYPTIIPWTYCLIWPNHSQYNDFPHYLHITGFTWVFYYIFTPIYVTFFLMLFIFNCYLFIRIYYVMRKRTKQNLNSSVDTESQLRQVVMMLMVNGVVFFMFCFLQICMMLANLLHFIAPEAANLQENVLWLIIPEMLFAVNAFVNPIIYFILNKRYRDAFKDTIFNHKSNQRNKQDIDLSKIETISRINCR